MAYDPRDVTVRIGNVDIPNIEEVDPTFGKTIKPVSGSQGFVGHMKELKETTLKVKFRAEPKNEAVATLSDYFANDEVLTVTYICPEFTVTITDAMLHSYPVKAAAINDLAVYDIELSGKSAGPRYA